MRGSRKNARVERKLEEVIEALVAAYTGAKDKDKAVMENWAAVKGVADAAREIAYAAVVAAECSRSGRSKRYEARYYIGGNGVTGNLTRSWEASDTEGMPPPSPRTFYCFIGISLNPELFLRSTPRPERSTW